MKIKMIPLSQLARSPDNVRKTGSKQVVESLAASISVHGLLQNLQVRETAANSYEVLAGAQRLAALKLLVKRKALAKDAKIACNVIDVAAGNFYRPFIGRSAGNSRYLRQVQQTVRCMQNLQSRLQRGFQLCG